MLFRVDDAPIVIICTRTNDGNRWLEGNRVSSANQLWQRLCSECARDYNGRATVECRIDELKKRTGGRPLLPAIFLCDRVGFLGGALWVHSLRGISTCFRSGAQDLRFEVFTCGAILGRSGHHLVLHMSKTEVERFWRPLWRWLIGRLPQLEKGYSLDLDSKITAALLPLGAEATDHL